MAIITQHDVTLNPSQVNTLCQILRDFHTAQISTIRTTKSAAIRVYAEERAHAAAMLEDELVRKLYAQEGAR